jgi:hypothetical protein
MYFAVIIIQDDFYSFQHVRTCISFKTELRIESGKMYMYIFNLF